MRISNLGLLVTAIGLSAALNQNPAAAQDGLQARLGPEQAASSQNHDVNNVSNFSSLRHMVIELERTLGDNPYMWPRTLGHHVGEIVYDEVAKLAERYGLGVTSD